MVGYWKEEARSPKPKSGSATSAPQRARGVLVRLFDDDDPDVRKAVARRSESSTSPTPLDRRTRCGGMRGHPSLPDNFGDLVHAQQSLRLLPSTTIIACERAVEHADV